MIWTAHEAREIDRISTETHGIPTLSLMNEAGQAIYRLALSLWKPYTSFAILAGGGNNGGDALVLAQLLLKAGFDLKVFDVVEGKETPERRHQREVFAALGGQVLPFDSAEDFSVLKGEFILVDGLLGLGLKGPLRIGKVANCLRAARDLRFKYCLAIDLPSGMNADLWDQSEPLLAATHTMTFGALKPLHVGQPSRKHCGEIQVASIGFSSEAILAVLAQRTMVLEHFTRSEKLVDLWTHLEPDAHKYDRGHVLCLGGSPGKIGAILLAAEAAWQAGAGWVSVAPLSEVFAPAWPREFTYESFALEGEIEEKILSSFIEKRKVKAILIGPGAMNNPLNKSILKTLSELQKSTGLRLIFDAGALDDFLSLAEGLVFDPERTLLTPHPGEWKRMHKSLGEIRGVEDLSRAAEKLRGFTVIYKSATPIVLTPTHARFLTKGDNTLARAGSGDRLAGMILGLATGPRPLSEVAALAQNLMAAGPSSKSSD